MDDSIAGLRAFVAFAESGGFTAAGERLGLSRSAVSKAVTRLEERLGRRLVDRSSRSLQLTEEGGLLLQHGRRVLDELDLAAQALHATDDEVSGLVRIDLPPLYGRQVVMPILRDVSDRYPRLRFDLGFSPVASELVAEGVHLAVRIGVLPDRAELIARSLGRQPTRLYAAPVYLQANPPVRDPADLSLQRCLLADVHDDWEWLPGAPRLRGPFVLRDTCALLEGCIAGLGVACLPDWLARPYVARGELIPVLPEHPGPVLPIHVIWPRGRYLPARVRVVIDALVEMLAD
ncbi:LysR family transcriptional regulator [Pseudomonas sp. PDM23]|uniref:LysR family transcriptional regulator n=1 Tax=unclassified Pseudomonas TaxID=196821 RepID=UPI001786E94B|nr:MULTISPECIES: LysR family transcriptional regulator [unclassified Pseudomonas]MBD9579197.1 LysR family transcriptional regulator [Pseudomonas sp. PDM23]MBD9672817.1 LysR family transcriptional regulator [Pseudomonas sp. PDM21]